MRATELHIDEVIQDKGARKVPGMTEMLLRRGIGWDEVAFLGDDLADVPVLRRVGLPMAVSNAVAEVKQLAAYTTIAPGGSGAVRRRRISTPAEMYSSMQARRSRVSLTTR